MSKVRTSVVIDAAPQQVWDVVADVAGHVDWMADAVAIRFTSGQREGEGTTFDCDTKFGPFKLTDRMEITEWCPPVSLPGSNASMGVRHAGLVTGEGRFTLRPAQGERTRFTWKERLAFPWWMGGPVGALAAKPLMGAVWRRNLGRLKARIEGHRSSSC